MLTKDLAHQRYLRVKMVPYHKSLEVHNNFFLLCCKEPMSLSYHFAGLLCRKQKDFSLSRPSSREDGSIAKVIRSQFLYPTPHPDKSFPTCYSSNKIVTSKVDWKKKSCTNQMQWSVLSNQVRRRRIPGRRTTNSSFASLQQKSMSSLMPCRQDRSNFTCSKLQKISHPISKSLMVSCSMEKYVWWLTDHYKHGTLRFARACDGIDALQFLPAYICSFSKNFNSSVEEFHLCVLQEFWNCSLVKQNCV